MSIDARNILESISGFSQSGQGTTKSSDRPVRIGVIEPFYTAGLARVKFEGEETFSAKGYTWQATYRPRGGDRVYLLPVGQSYIIGGKVSGPTTELNWYPFDYRNGWADYTLDNIYYTPGITMTETGVVILRGLMTGTTVANNTVIAVLPEPFRPARKMSFITLMNNSPAGVEIFPDGEVRLGLSPSNGSYLSLDNIMFYNGTNAWTNHALTNGWAVNSIAEGGDVPTPQYALDQCSRVWHRGAITRSSAPDVTSPINLATIPQARPAYEYHMPNYGGSTFSFADITREGVFRWKPGGGNPGLWALDSFHYAKPSAFDTTDWSALPLQNGWLNNSADHAPLGYWKDREGIVHLRGLVKSGTMGSAIGTLPVGFRPSKRYLKIAVSANASGRLDVMPDGRLIPTLASNTWFSIDGTSFVGEQ